MALLKQYAAGCGLAKRGRDDAGGTLSLLLCLMQNGEDWRVADIVAAIRKGGIHISSTYVSAKLSAGATAGGPFERVSRGVYRLKPEVAARWAKPAA
jgi:hypothetical protein